MLDQGDGNATAVVADDIPCCITAAVVDDNGAEARA